MNVYTKTESGMGDFLAQYLGDGLFKYMKHLKTNGFKSQIINWDYTHNACTLNIAELNPYFKSEQKPWGAWAEYNNNKDIIKLEDLFDWTTIPEETPEFYLSDGEQKWVEGLPKEYYALHAQAGHASRALVCHLCLEDLITHLAKTMPVVLLGGSGPRCGMGRNLDEHYNWEHPNLINCIDKQNARTQCEVVKRCTKFVGGFSAYEVAASYLNKPSVVGVPGFTYRECKANKGAYFTKANLQPNMKIINWEEPSFYERFLEAIGER